MNLEGLARSLVAEVQQASLDMQLEDEATGDAEQNADADALMPLRDSAIAILGSGEDWKEEGAYGSIDVVVERELRAKSKSMSAMARGQVLSARTRGALPVSMLASCPVIGFICADTRAIHSI